MEEFDFKDLELSGAKLISPFYVEDERGCFYKYFERDIYLKNGININNIQEGFESVSRKGVIRGLHYQENEQQIKLVRVVVGRIKDVIVDLRKNSKTFGKYYSVILSDKNKKVLYIPKGFAHGFICLSEVAVVSYLCNGKYLKKCDSGILWNDPDLNIKWADENMEITISDRDSKLQSFHEFCKNQ